MDVREQEVEERAVIAGRLLALRARIDAAARRAGRDPAAVHLLGASKRQSPARIAAAARSGLCDFGENYVQEAAAKIPLVREILGSEEADLLRWHAIGHMQRNKARQAVGCFDRIHGVDSARLAIELAHAAEAAGRVVPVLLQVNLSGEPQKAGVAPDAVPELLAAVSAHASLRATGLMTLPAPTADPEAARPVFARLRALRDELRTEPGGANLTELSMGMSQDFEVAVEEGATWVRIGTELFGPRPGGREDA
ncbi:YggS family pyridoxal phosphate-dependent enzyme [Myxococcota bacterium]|nr:YggS family pyridoxal phosphate-dependent enzyme [Myxococcota bacterium]MCZ7619620.1 YggS family pyridoxal phosphate-dependent enzyme [Myxococcota bacterium]